MDAPDDGDLEGGNSRRRSRLRTATLGLLIRDSRAGILRDAAQTIPS
jgi:hypothetical protein